ncbi:transporter, major facilitator family protein [Aeromicrobium marinum DSM 15272]|uniref:Transporter, major facilitator family protein n=1 Tax=Aeromicrobium marinum DSM 15272 TaxID=585531 RepID=E2SEG1_9ACTN|nr:nitrate/nitrite transporter [Aeromicrobium marinum]EFQ82438.1 transporter, major facilitator family protein [Aeromicrobium marinum DSM 15272]
MTSVVTPATEPPTEPGDEAVVRRRTGRWIEHWDPEDPDFWESSGRQVARRNLVWSIFAEHLGFSVWLLWSVSAAMLARAGFDFSAQQLFFLVAVPNLVGSLLRLPYTFAVPTFGGRNWTMISAALLVVPTVLFVIVVQRPDTPYWAFVVIAATAGFGGGNFSSSMTNINYFYPTRLKGSALGLNAAGGNIGVALIQFFLPIIVGAGGAFGAIKAADAINLQRVGYLYAVLAVIGAVAAYLFMNNLASASGKPRETLAVARYKHTWIMSLLYIGTFGSFIGYSAAMPLLIKINFFRSPIPTESIGINFVYYAFLGALVGSLTRPFGGWLADRVGGARVTLGCFLAMIVGTLGVFYSLTLLDPVPVPAPEQIAAWTADPASFPGFSPEITAAVNHNSDIFPWFLGLFLFVFAATGIANGSTYKMIPHIFKAQAQNATTAGTDERRAAEARAVKEGSAALGIIGAAGAMGGFLIPITFGSPWVGDPVEACKAAFMVFAAYYVLCSVVTWSVYRRPGATMAEAGV